MKTILLSISVLLVGNLTFSQGYADNCLDSLEVPSSITPNGDAIDDFLSVDFDCPPDEFSFTVYDRWGAEVYKTADPKFQWVATDENGKNIPPGVVIWKMSYTFNDKEVSKTGHLTIVG